MEPLNYQNRTDAREESSGGFLRKIFGPSQAEVWEQLAKHVNGSRIKGGFWQRDKFVAKVGAWAVTLDTFTRSNGKTSHTYTRLRAPYVNRDGFRFTIHRSDFFTYIGEMLGFKDISIGDPKFDDAFVIKSNDEARVRALLANPEIRRLAQAQKSISLTVQDDEGWFGAHFPEGVDELHFTAGGVIRDVEVLHQLFDLFALVLNRLCHIGSAYENDPGVTL